MSQGEPEGIAELLEQYRHQAKKMEAAQRFKDIAAKQEQESRMQDRLSQWQDAVEELAKVEATLAKLIAHETGWHVPQKHGAMLNWPGRLDTIIGELGRYRETLMRRVADGLLPRLTQDIDQENVKAFKQAFPEI